MRDNSKNDHGGDAAAAAAAPPIASSKVTLRRDEKKNTPVDIWLLRLMQCINAVSLCLFLTPPSFRILLGWDVALSTQRDYLETIEPFLPDIVVGIVFPRLPIPIQVLDITTSRSTTFGDDDHETASTTRIYFPGVAVDCVLGIVQGLVLGTHLLLRSPSGRLSHPWLPALAVFFFATMCLSALPLHCLRDLALFNNGPQPTLMTHMLCWIDTFSTSSSCILVLFSTLVEHQYLDATTATDYVLLSLNACGTIISLAVAHSNRIIMALMHVGLGTLILPLVLFIICKRRCQNTSIQEDGMLYIGVANLVFFLGGIPLLLATNASTASKWTHGTYCVLTSFFVASRIAVVEYWAFCCAQARCFSSISNKNTRQRPVPKIRKQKCS